MKVISINVGLPRLVMRGDEPVSTGIFKEPIDGQVALRTLNLDGDRQADLTVHGGPNKAVYVYPAEHYDYWRSELRKISLPWGSFGENFTTRGLFETETNIGDRFRVGSAEVIVTQPRMPCYKLGIRFGDPGMLRKFLASELTGFYLAVAKEGEVEAGDRFEQISTDPHGVKVIDVVRLYANEKNNVDLLRRALEVEALPASWRDYLAEKLSRSNTN